MGRRGESCGPGTSGRSPRILAVRRTVVMVKANAAQATTASSASPSPYEDNAP
jgi:hypothetical protein